MARPLVVQFAGMEYPLALDKVERSDLYGYTETLTLDDEGQPCTLATLAQDGKTLIGAGGTAQGYVSTDGRWLERTELTPIDLDGKPIEPVPSSFSAPIDLTQTATVEELLDHNVRSVYLMTSEADLASLQKELDGGTIFKFDFSYRGGLASDTAFLLKGQDGGIFMLVAQPAFIDFVGLAQAAPAVEDDEQADEDDEDPLDMSFF